MKDLTVAVETEVAGGPEMTDEDGNSLNLIVVMSERLTDMTRQISTVTEDQAATANEINQQVEFLLSVTPETARGTGPSAAGAEGLPRQADRLQSIVGQFIIKQPDICRGGGLPHCQLRISPLQFPFQPA